MWKSFFGGLICGLILITTPPCSTFVTHWLESWWIPAQFLRSIALVQGSHESIIVAQACELGLFDRVDDLTRCGIFTCECTATPSILVKKIEVSFQMMLSLLDALRDMGLVRVSGESYCLAAISKRFLTGDHSVCGMAIASSHREVLWRLSSLRNSGEEEFSETLSFLRPREAIESAKGEGDLWSAFAKATAVFSRNAAGRVATSLKDHALTLKDPWVFDVGCGSGEYLRAVMSTLGASAKGVYVDLPEVLKETKVLHEFWAKELRQEFLYYPASILDDSIALMLTRPQAQKIVMINNVLQHLSDKEISVSLHKIVDSVRQGCEAHTCGFIVVTELIKRSSTLWEVPEVIPITAVFDVVLKAITTRGGVRTVARLLSIVEGAGITLVSHSSLFPMPAIVLIFAVHQ